MMQTLNHLTCLEQSSTFFYDHKLWHEPYIFLSKFTIKTFLQNLQKIRNKSMTDHLQVCNFFLTFQMSIYGCSSSEHIVNLWAPPSPSWVIFQDQWHRFPMACCPLQPVATVTRLLACHTHSKIVKHLCSNSSTSFYLVFVCPRIFIQPFACTWCKDHV